jgi:hypothetical protein
LRYISSIQKLVKGNTLLRNEARYSEIASFPA